MVQRVKIIQNGGLKISDAKMMQKERSPCFSFFFQSSIILRLTHRQTRAIPEIIFHNERRMKRFSDIFVP